MNLIHGTTRGLALGLAFAASAGVLGAQTVHYGAGANAGTAQSAFLGSGTSAYNDLSTGGTSVSFGALGTGTLSGASASGGYIGTGGNGGVTPMFTITFSQMLSGFGGIFGDLGTCCGGSPFPNGTLRFDLFAGGVPVGSFAQAFTTSSWAFFGVTGAPGFDEVRLFANSGDVVDVDHLAVVAGTNTVPEPATMVLLGTGLLAIAGVARRRTRREQA